MPSFNAYEDIQVKLYTTNANNRTVPGEGLKKSISSILVCEPKDQSSYPSEKRRISTESLRTYDNVKRLHSQTENLCFENKPFNTRLASVPAHDAQLSKEVVEESMSENQLQRT